MKEKRLPIYILMSLILMLTMGLMTGCGKDEESDNSGKVASTEAVLSTASTEEVVVTTETPKDADGFIVSDDYVETLGDTINVRVSPSTDADIYMLLEAGEVLKRTGYNDEWTRVLVDNENFYIYSDYVVLTQAPADESAYEATVASPGDAAGSGKELVKKIVIDPAKQANINVNQEQVGPGSEETKIGASTGNVGDTFGTKEYTLNLQYANLLKTEMESRGYEVILTRTDDNVDLSNQARAQLANESGATVFIRIQMNYSENKELSGAMAVCMTQDSQFNADLYGESSKLATRLLQGIIEQTEADNHGVYETDGMTVINWSSIPVVVIMPGYLSNENDEANLTSAEYQADIIKGIANGIDYYFAQ